MRSPGQTVFPFRPQPSPCPLKVPLFPSAFLSCPRPPAGFLGAALGSPGSDRRPVSGLQDLSVAKVSYQTSLFSSSFLAQRLPAQAHKARQLPTLAGSKAPTGRRREALTRAPSLSTQRFSQLLCDKQVPAPSVIRLHLYNTATAIQENTSERQGRTQSPLSN